MNKLKLFVNYIRDNKLNNLKVYVTPKYLRNSYLPSVIDACNMTDISINSLSVYIEETYIYQDSVLLLFYYYDEFICKSICDTYIIDLDKSFPVINIECISERECD